MGESVLAPIDPVNVSAPDEEEKSAPWVVRKLVDSIPGRIAISSYESLRATGTSIICLSPWGDSSPLLLPCIRFRDLAVQTVIVATGGMAAVAAPVMGPVSEAAVASLGSTILVELAVQTGVSLSTKVANDLVFSKPLNKLLPLHDARLETTSVKELIITLKLKLAMEDAQLGFFRSSVHSDPSLFSTFKDYLSDDKGWFSPYLFASARRPVIPRSMKPDIIFCHGPFLLGDYSIGETLLAESASVIILCNRIQPIEEEAPEDSSSLSNLKPQLKERLSSVSNFFKNRSRSPSPTPGDSSTDSGSSQSPATAEALHEQPQVLAHPPRHMVITVVGLKPHRSLWTTSKRPGESVIRYLLLNGCVSIVVPVKSGAPLVAWDVLTLNKLWDIDLPPAQETAESSDITSKPDGPPKSASGKFEGVVEAIQEYLGLCVDWDRMLVPQEEQEEGSGETDAATQADATVGDVDVGSLSIDDGVSKSDLAAGLGRKQEALKDAVSLLVASAIRSKDSEAVKEMVDEERAGIAMWRIR